MQLGHKLSRLRLILEPRCGMCGAAASNRPSWLHSQASPIPRRLSSALSPNSTRGRPLTAAVSTDAAPATSPPSSSSSRPNVVAVLRSRGLVQDVTNADQLEAAAAAESLLVYCGFDPTADSLHLGNLLGIIVLSWFQRCGHTPVALLGGATGRVGDPSGKSAERPVLDEPVIEANTAAIEATLRRLLAPPADTASAAPLVVNNLEWFGAMPLLTFLRDIGKMARVGTMIGKESVRKRMESEAGISYTEFTYQLLQGYDFVHLARERGVRVQVGGSDQWGNITAGTDLVRRMLPGEAEEGDAPPLCFGLTFPLLLKADGTKFGKSESGALWLSPEKLSAYEFYQFLLKTADEDIPRFLRMLTFLPLEEIDALVAAMAAPDYVPNTSQRRLAEEVTRFVRGEEGLQQALAATAALAPGSTAALDPATLEAAAANAPSAALARSEVVGALLADVMVAVGMQPSKAAGRRMIKGGGVRVNNVKVDDEGRVLVEEDLVDGRMLLLAAGKKNKILVRVE